jgi:hypothetical protein
MLYLTIVTVLLVPLQFRHRVDLSLSGRKFKPAMVSLNNIIGIVKRALVSDQGFGWPVYGHKILEVLPFSFTAL